MKGRREDRSDLKGGREDGSDLKGGREDNQPDQTIEKTRQLNRQDNLKRPDNLTDRTVNIQNNYTFL